MVRNSVKANRIREAVIKGASLLCALISILSVLLICYFLFLNGGKAIGKIGLGEFVLGRKWAPSQNIYGIYVMIIGSIYVTAGAIICGVPMGILCAVYLAYYCGPKTYRVLKPAIRLMAGIPSVVYGFFGLVVIVPAIQKMFGGSGKGVLTASLMLGIMILPTIVNITETALRAVPKPYTEAALALGATKERTIFQILIPAAKSGISAAVVLGIGRAIGEAMAVSMVAGNQKMIPKSILSGVRTMTTNIVMEMGYAQDLHREALIATGVVLFVFILLINLSFFALKGRKEQA